MLTAIIADDEKHIISLIRNLADWNGLGISVIGEVQDGIDALQLVRKLKPDILLTDIRMPGMDGLELSHKAKEMDSNISIVIISGHKQFDYAYGAIKYGVEDFLIKPINRAELNDVLSRICRKRHANLGEAEHLLHLERKILDGESTIRKLLIEEGIKEKGTLGTAQAALPIEAFSGGLKRKFCCFAVKFDFRGSSDSSYETILDHADTILLDYFSAKGIGADLSISGDLVACLLTLESGDSEAILRLMKNFNEELHLRLDIFPDLALTIGLGEPFGELELTPLAVREAIAAVKCKAILGAGSVIPVSRIGPRTAIRTLSEEQSFRLSRILEAYSEEALRAWLENILGTDAGAYLEKPWEAVGLGESVFDEFRQKADQLGVNVAGEYWSAFAAELSNASSLGEMSATLERGIVRIVQANYEEKLNRENLPVRMAKQYMQDHLRDQIRLEDIAASATLSPAYFSSLFKKSTGINVSEYLLDMRIAEAKRLLKSSTFNISEIADQVGYSDPKHFSKVFAKATLVKPHQYRKLYSR